MLQTYKVAERFKLSEDIKTACFLHDTLEDTETTYNELKKHFGQYIAELVYAVTDELGRNRKERKAKTYKKIRKFGIDAVLLKLCDRIANVENAIQTNNAIIKMYQREHKYFAERLDIFDGDYPDIWEHYIYLMREMTN